MPRKQISVSEQTYTRLKQNGKYGDSMDKIIQRLLKARATA